MHFKRLDPHFRIFFTLHQLWELKTFFFHTFFVRYGCEGVQNKTGVENAC